MRNYLERVTAALERGQRFVTHDVWRIGRPGEVPPHGLIIKNVRVAILLVRGVMEETLLLRAAALTFATLLFIVPFLTFMFFFITTFNLGEGVYQRLSDQFDAWLTESIDLPWQWDLEPSAIDAEARADFLAGRALRAQSGAVAAYTGDLPGHRAALADRDAFAARLKPGAPGRRPANGGPGAVNEELKEHLLSFVLRGVGQPETADSAYTNPVQMLVGMAETGARDLPTLGISGLIFVLTTVFGLMRNVELSFNAIWGVARNRNYFRVLRDYLVITVLLPFGAAAVLGITAALESESVYYTFGPMSIAALRSVQFGVICLTASLLNWLVPNTHVRFRYALLGGTFAGCLWVLNSWAYVRFQVGLARYTLFFSGFAMFPLLMMWIYLSWVILLFGALLTFACQNEKTFAMEQYADNASFAYREALGIRILVELARRFREGKPGLTAAEAADAWNVPMRLVNETVDELIAAGFVSRVAGDPPRYQPGRSPDHVRVRDALRVLRETGRDPSLLRQDPRYKPVYTALANGDRDCLDAFIADLVTRTEPEIPPPDTAS
jgi:YihY family inner membrane protein